MTSFTKVISEISAYSRVMGTMQSDYHRMAMNDISRHKVATDEFCSKMKWQGWTTVALCSTGACLGVASAVVPKEQLSSILKTSSVFCGGINQAADSWYRSSTTQIESKREFTRLLFQEEQQERSTLSQELKRAQESALSLIQAKSKSQ